MQANAKLIFIFFIFIALRVTAQKNSSDSMYSIAPYQIIRGAICTPDYGFIYDWQTNSTTFTNNFLFDLNRDLILTQESKKNSEKKLNARNYFVNQEQGAGYLVLPVKSKPTLGVVLELSAVSFQDVSFGRGTFELILNGNAHYKNEKKEIGNLYYRQIEYQQVGIGIRQYFKNKTQCINASINFIKGDYANQFKITRGSVFTEENGEYIDIDLAYDRHFSASGAGLLSPKGFGASLNFNWTKFFAGRNATLSINIKDIGGVHYGASTAHQSIDTSVHFTGVDVGDVSNLSSLNTINAKDSLLNKFNIRSKNEAFNFTLPTLLELKYEQCISRKSLLQFQANAYLYNALPLLKVGYLYALNKYLYLGGDIRTGGYSKFDLDISTRYCTRKIFIEASIKSVEGLISPKYASGLGAFAHLGFYL